MGHVGLADQPDAFKCRERIGGVGSGGAVIDDDFGHRVRLSERGPNRVMDMLRVVVVGGDDDRHQSCGHWALRHQW